MSLTYQLTYIITIFLNAALAVLIFLRRPTQPLVRAFLAFILSLIGWIVSLYFFYSIHDSGHVLLLGRLNYVMAILIAYTAFLFVYLFPEKRRTISTRTHYILAGITILFSLITMFTGLIDYNEIVRGVGRVTVYGSLFPVYIVYFCGLILYSFYSLFAKLIFFTGKSRALVIIFLVGWGLGMVIGISTNLLIPYFTGHYDAQNLGPLATVFFVIAMSYAVAKHEMMDLKVMTAEFFVTLMLLFFVINSIISVTLVQQTINAVIFVFGLFVGIALIDSVKKEVERRKELQTLSEELAIANVKLEERDLMRGEFISMASHQLRTPVSVMKGYISLMLDGDFGRIPKKIVDKLQLMFEMNERLVLLVNNMLNASRIEKNRIDFGFGEVKIDEIGKSVVQEMTFKAQQKKLHLRLNKYKGDMPVIVSDSEKIREIMVNLIDNAIKYTGEGFVELGFDVDRTNEHILVYVKDSGYGMTEDDAKHVFEKFYRADRPDVPKEHGTGLGLYIVTRFLGGMGGSIWISETAPGKGTTIMFTVPFNPPENMRRPETQIITKK
ncbi:MAG: ATP-binding protein [Patescibacteria group bacterium]